jgi:CheY-like chemotaxis protein
MILKSKLTPPSTPLAASPPETLEDLQKERAKLIVQLNALERRSPTFGPGQPLPSEPRRGGRHVQAQDPLVDDREENLSVLEALMGDLNATTVRATSGPEALQRLLEEDYALVLMDVLMPEMDGFETATLVHRRKRSRSTPIVFLTAHGDDPALRLRGYKAGAVDYLQKPIVPKSSGPRWPFSWSSTRRASFSDGRRPAWPRSTRSWRPSRAPSPTT